MNILERRAARLHSIGIGTLVGVWWWPYWGLLMMAPDVAASTGLPTGSVVSSVLLGSALVGTGAFGFTRVGRDRRRLVRWAAPLVAAPLLALEQLSAPLAVVALVAVGALMSAADGAVQSAVTATLGDEASRRSSITAYFMASTTAMFVGGPLCEWLARDTGVGGMLGFLAPITVVFGWWIGLLCPDADRAPAKGARAVTSASGEGRGWLAWLIVSRTCVNAALSMFAVFVPLALSARGVAGIGWTQVAPVVGVMAAGVAAWRKTGGVSLLSTRGAALSGPLVICGAAALALAGVLAVDGALLALLLGTLIRAVASMGSGLHGCTVAAVAGVTARGKAGNNMGQALGAMLAGVVGSWVWSTASFEGRFQVVAAVALAMSVCGLAATGRWLAACAAPTGVPSPATTGRWWGVNDVISVEQAAEHMSVVLAEVRAGRATRISLEGTLTGASRCVAVIAPLARATVRAEEAVRVDAEDVALEGAVLMADVWDRETVICQGGEPVAVVVPYDADRDYVFPTSV